MQPGPDRRAPRHWQAGCRKDSVARWGMFSGKFWAAARRDTYSSAIYPMRLVNVWRTRIEANRAVIEMSAHAPIPNGYHGKFHSALNKTPTSEIVAEAMHHLIAMKRFATSKR